MGAYRLERTSIWGREVDGGHKELLDDNRSRGVEVTCTSNWGREVVNGWGREVVNGYNKLLGVKQWWNVLGDVILGDSVVEEVLTNHPQQGLDVGQVDDLKGHIKTTGLVEHLQLIGEHVLCNVITNFTSQPSKEQADETKEIHFSLNSRGHKQFYMLSLQALPTQ